MFAINLSYKEIKRNKNTFLNTVYFLQFEFPLFELRITAFNIARERTDRFGVQEHF